MVAAVGRTKLVSFLRQPSRISARATVERLALKSRDFCHAIAADTSPYQLYDRISLGKSTLFVVLNGQGIVKLRIGMHNDATQYSPENCAR